MGTQEGKMQEQQIIYRQSAKFYRASIYNASTGTFESQQISVWFLRVCLSSFYQYCKYTSEVIYTH